MGEWLAGVRLSETLPTSRELSFLALPDDFLHLSIPSSEFIRLHKPWLTALQPPPLLTLLRWKTGDDLFGDLTDHAAVRRRLRETLRRSAQAGVRVLAICFLTPSQNWGKETLASLESRLVGFLALLDHFGSREGLFIALPASGNKPFEELLRRRYQEEGLGCVIPLLDEGPYHGLENPAQQPKAEVWAPSKIDQRELEVLRQAQLRWSRRHSTVYLLLPEKGVNAYLASDLQPRVL